MRYSSSRIHVAVPPYDDILFCRFAIRRDTIAGELAINYCRNGNCKKKQIARGERERDRKRDRKKGTKINRAAKRHCLAIARGQNVNVAIGGNEIGPSEKLHSRAMRNDTVISHYRHIVVWNCSFRRLRNALSALLAAMISRAFYLRRDAPRRGTWRDVSIVKTASQKNFSFDLDDRFSKRCNPV